ncbi:MAG: DegT/DnrJ/EryC1/StrS family aminotransferase, partial [Planctomycetota bacterium]
FGIGRVVLEMLNCSKTTDVEHVENKFAETFKVPYALLLPSARAGISWALKTAIEPGTKVICPVYTSEVVHEAVVRAGGQLHLIDTQENGFLMEQAILSSAQIGNQPVVLCEIYGYTYNLSGMEWNTQNTPPICIVDMAMTVPGLRLTERLRENDIGFLSFGIAKSMYSGWGGMCFTKNMALAGEIRKIRDSSLIPNNLLFSLKRSLNILLRTLTHGKVLYGLSRKVKDIEVRVKSRNQYQKKENCMLRWQKGEALSPEWFAPSTRLDRRLVCYNLAHAEYYWNRRISLATRYHDNLKAASGIILPQVSPFPLSHYTIRVNSGIRLQLREYLYSRGIDTGASFAVPQYICKDDYPNAAVIASEVLNLPLGPYLTFNDIDYISENLIRGVSKNNIQED